MREQSVTGGPATLVVFDVDGTLVDSERDGHRVAFNDAFAALGLPYSWGVEEYGRLLQVAGGRPRLARFLVDAGHTPQEAEELSARLHAHKTALFRERAASGDVPLRPGVGDLVAGLAASGVTLAVATTGSRSWVDPLLLRYFSRGTFAAVVTGTEVADLKPHPAAYLAVLAALRVPAHRAVAVEDSANGVAAATAAGLACLAVRNDYTRDDDLSGASMVLDSFAGLSGADVLALAGHHGAPERNLT